jgi:hypothetical protein
MSATEDLVQQEIEDLISTIRKLTTEYLRRGSNTIPDIRLQLDHLKDFIAPVVNYSDLSDVVDDYIENMNSLVNFNSSSSRLLLKTSITKLEQEFDEFKHKKQLYKTVMLFSSR